MDSIEKTNSKILSLLTKLNRANLLLSLLITTGVICLVEPKLLNLSDQNNKFQDTSLTEEYLLNKISQTGEDINNIAHDYTLQTTNILSRYYSTQSRISSNLTLDKEYYNIVNTRNYPNQLYNIIGTMDSILCKFYFKEETKVEILSMPDLDNIIPDTINNSINKYNNEGSTYSQVKKLIKECKECKINMPEETKNTTNCDKCGNNLEINHEEFNLYCIECGQIFPMVNTFDNVYVNIENLAAPKSNNTLSTSHIPEKHYDSWMSKILGTCKKGYNDSDIDIIKKYIIEFNISQSALTYNKVREIIHKLKISNKLNKYITSILIDLNGDKPPELSYNDLLFHRTVNIRIINVHDDLYGSSGNRPFYQFFIKQVFDLMYPDPNNKRKILDYIHTQSHSTTAKNIEKWNTICKHDTGIITMIENFAQKNIN